MLQVANSRDAFGEDKLGIFIYYMYFIYITNYTFRYMLELGTCYVMDCAQKLDTCKASRINSWKKIARFNDSGKQILAQQNCKIVYDLANHIISVEAIRNIIRFEELFCEYGRDYDFYPQEDTSPEG